MARARGRTAPALLPRGLLRSLRLLALPAGTAALGVQGAVRRLAGQDPARVQADLRRRNAARTRRVLGDLKGGALKAGQLLSTVEALFPQDPDGTWTDALISMQESNAALAFDAVEPVLAAELGPSWRVRFAAFDEHAAAAASIGQVHRATWADGRPVAVKVQYPGVREALSTDVRVVSALSRLAALIAPGLALPPLVRELRERLTEELDYLHEADVQTRFADAYADDPDVVVPRVVTATPRVLVMDWMDGTPIARLAGEATQAERDDAAGRYQRFIVSGPERAGLLHTDPHPGNYRILEDGRLGVMDFGSSLALPQGMPATFGRLLHALLAEEPAAVLTRLREAGFVRPDADVEVDKLLDYMRPFTEPARHETFHFTRDWLRGQFGRINDPRNPEFSVALQLNVPAEHLFTHRVWLGMVGVFCQLEARLPVRSVLQRWVPGFTPPAPADA